MKSTVKPAHIAIIMDGNNRWAKAKGLPGIAGHQAGVKSVRAVVEACVAEKISALTLFAFSSENWQRPALEVAALMELFSLLLKREVKKLHQENVRLRIMGDRSRFSQKLQQQMQEAEQLTEKNAGLTLVIAANYGGQWDIAQAAKQITVKVQAGLLNIDDITPEVMNQYIELHDLPAVDLCIRTSGEQRISNFLLWQLAYAELYFTDVYWPDFRKEQLQLAIDEFTRRQRRFGGR